MNNTMNSSSILIISSLLFLYTQHLSKGDSCYLASCPRGVNTSVLLPDVSIRYPFYLNDSQPPKSCGKPGFELYCDKALGILIQLPNNVVLGVYDISHYDEHIILSDPIDDCLPQKLMSLNLTNTPFRPAKPTKNLWLYNCSGISHFGYDRVDCLSGSDYTVISSKSNITDVVSSICTFLKILIAPSYTYIFDFPSTIDLTWAGTTPPPPGENFRSEYSSTTSPVVTVIIGLSALSILLVLVWCCCFRAFEDEQAPSTTTNNNNTISSASIVVGGIDQVTLDSYPVVVVGESGRLIKPDNDTCPICLDHYQAHETLKTLPECLHRFHADCIDQWLRSKGICPICRTSPPRHS